VAASPSLAEALHALLPQTQCTRCGYDGCRPYAEAIAGGAADINRCPPGGETTLQRLATLTGLPVRPIDPECGTAGPPMVAVIDAARCIGCARCLPPCPVDAIVGAPRTTQAPFSTEPAAGDNLRRYEAHRARRERREADRLALLAERKARAARLSTRRDGGAP
jgi:RnfABCDGE-type electron transport complex B subunit